MMQFTDKAKTALQLATKAAKDLHQNYVGSEHLLVGLAKERWLFAKSYKDFRG